MGLSPALSKTPPGQGFTPPTAAGFSVVAATTNHAYHLAPFLKESDRTELQAASGNDTLCVLLDSLVLSNESWAILRHEAVIGLFGISAQDEIGIPWFLSTDAIEACPKFINTLALQALRYFHGSYPLLMNYCDARAEKSIRWLKWCGFKFIDLIPDYGVEKRSFYQFVRIKEG
jgi:hypothetical protein